MNIITALTGGAGGLSGGIMPILMKAAGAYMRGESPQAFLRNLAQTHPALRGLDLNDLEGTANRIAAEKGTTVDQVAETVKKTVGGFM